MDIRLHKAIENDNVKVVKKLLYEEKVDVHLEMQGESPLHRVALFPRTNAVRILKLLLGRGGDANKRNWCGHTPAMTAAAKNSLGFFKTIMRHSTTAEDETDILIYVAANLRHGPAITKYLIQKNKVYSQILQRNSGISPTPFFGEVYTATCNTMSAFIDYGGDINAVNGNNTSAMISRTCPKRRRTCPLRRTIFKLTLLKVKLHKDVERDLKEHETLNYNLQVEQSNILLEIAHLKVDKCTPFLTWYDFLIANRAEAIMICKIPLIAAELGNWSFKYNYRHYGTLIQTKFYKSQERFDLLSQGFSKFCWYISDLGVLGLERIIWEKASYYFSNQDLKNFIQ